MERIVYYAVLFVSAVVPAAVALWLLILFIVNERQLRRSRQAIKRVQEWDRSADMEFVRRTGRY